MWERAVGLGSHTWADANAYCGGLMLAGRNDWRLPTEIELLSLVDYTKSKPAIDPTSFPNTPAGAFWSSTPFRPTIRMILTVNFRLWRHEQHRRVGYSPCALCALRMGFSMFRPFRFSGDDAHVMTRSGASSAPPWTRRCAWTGRCSAFRRVTSTPSARSCAMLPPTSSCSWRAPTGAPGARSRARRGATASRIGSRSCNWERRCARFNLSGIGGGHGAGGGARPAGRRLASRNNECLEHNTAGAGTFCSSRAAVTVSAKHSTRALRPPGGRGRPAAHLKARAG